MRDLYRAKRKDTNQWVIGSYVYRIDVEMEQRSYGTYPIQPWNNYIVDATGQYHLVDEATICRAIGKVDACGTVIYEYDYLRIDNGSDILEVKWNNTECGYCYRFFDEGQEKWIYPDERNDLRVVGNFIDHPEIYKALHAPRLETESDDKMIPEDEPVITMENYRDFGLYSKDDVLEIISTALSKS